MMKLRNDGGCGNIFTCLLNIQPFILESFFYAKITNKCVLGISTTGGLRVKGGFVELRFPCPILIAATD